MKKFAVSALAIAALAGAAHAQPVRLEFRLVPQTGTPPAAVTDSALTTPATPITLSGTSRTQRYELQYRVLDLNTADNVFPAGLSAAQINITASSPTAGTFARAQLSRFERQTNNATTPPSSPDNSGLPLGGSSTGTGLHSPFRGGMADQNNNDLPANGTVAPNGILSILPLTISQPNQGNELIGSPNTAWWGLYSFTFTAADLFGGDITITAEAQADPNSGNRFGWFSDGAAVPEQSTNATAGVTHLRIVAIPAPGTAALVGLGGLVAFRRRRA